MALFSVCTSRKWSQDRKWSRTASDPGPQVIPILNRKWSRPKNKEWHGLILKWHTQNIFLFDKKYSIVVFIFFVLFLFFFCGKSVSFRDVLFRLFQDRLRFTVIDFVKVLVALNILERPRTCVIGFYFYCTWTTLPRCTFNFIENWRKNINTHTHEK